jgi:tetratricopeptide (TPR) repeat protein
MDNNVGANTPVPGAPAWRAPSADTLKTVLACLAVVVIVMVGWNRSAKTVARQELPKVPGAVVSREGTSAHTDLFAEALALSSRRNFVGAESIYREVLAHEPKSAPAYIGLGTARFQQKDFAGAQRHYLKALELDPSSSGAALGLGSVAYQQRQYATAVKYYRKALASPAAAADAHWGLGLAYDALGKVGEARRHYDAFLRLAPDAGQASVARTRLNYLSQ